jgi:hypothetical protein
MCAVPGSIVRPHPGHVYGFCAWAAETGCTVHSTPRRVSVRFQPAIMRARESSCDDSLRRRLARGIRQYQPTRCEWSHAPHGVPYRPPMYPRPHAICVAGFVSQSAPALAILLPGSACGMP